MPRGVLKKNLPEKICAVCRRSFSWRKKWELNWESVKHCSQHCRGRARAKRAGQEPSD